MNTSYPTSEFKLVMRVLALAIMLSAMSFFNAKAQFTDNFNGPLLTSGAAWTSWQSNLMFGYFPATPSAGPAFANQWFWSNGLSLTPAAPAPFSAGGMIKFNARNSAFAPGGAIDTGCAYIATPLLDFSARAGAAANVSFYLYHESYQTNILDPWSRSAADSVVVYVGNNDQLTGATRIGVVAADTVGFGPGNAWRQSTFAIPVLPQFNGCTNVVVMFVAYTWTSYRNIYVDNIYVDVFPSPQTVTGAVLSSQNTLGVALGSADNEIVGVKISVCGSTAPRQLDSIYFNPTGTSILADVSNAKLFSTGNSPTFSTATQVFATVNAPINNVAANNSLGFGNCAAPITLLTGDNYFWLTYSISPGATPGDIVDADLLNIVIHGTCLPGGSIAYGTPQSLAGGRPIGVSYCVASYAVGTSFAGYTINDFCASVYVSSVVGNPLFNQRHDIVTYPGCTGSAGQNCDRHSPHPPDYTLFPPATLSVDKDRTLSLRVAQGKRTLAGAGSIPDSVCVAAGTWFSANDIKVWIDFNGDGDFDDTYVGTGGNITEYIGVAVLSDNQAIGVLGSVPGAFPPAKQGDDWMSMQIHVPDSGELPSAIFPSGGPKVQIGTVRMRVREVFANTTFTPCNFQIFGETEDYDIALVTDCPAPGSKYCKWLGGNVINPTDWFTAGNWCPAIPTQLDTALIAPNGSGYYPIIRSNQFPECATLRIYSPASVTIDAPDVVSGGVLVPNTGKFKAYHNIEIGEAQNTSATMKVISSLTDSVITGVASAAGNVVISPFRGDKQDHKIQFIYSPTELSVMGLGSGDLLEQITFYIRSTIALGAGSLSQFTVKMWQMDNAYSYPAVLAAMTEVAVNNTAPTVLPALGGITVTQVFTQNPFPIPAIPANTTVPITINFTTRHALDATKYLCIEVTRDGPFAGGVGYPVLYESSILRSCLSLFNVNTNGTSGTIAANITGPGNGVGAAGVNLANGILANGTGASGGAALPFAHIAGTSYVFRPTSTIGFRRQYSKYPIEVGGNWINNNAGGLPKGFDAGWSVVKMLNNYVLGVHPNNDVDTIMGSEVTTFNELEINDANGVRMRVQGIANGNQGLIIDSSLIMTSGQLDLIQHRCDIKNPLPIGIQRTGGSILSENISNYNKVQWSIGTNTGAHVIPFGATAAAADYIPFTFTLTSGDVGDLTVSTYRTIPANLPLPVLPAAVNNLYNFACVDNSANTIDRFWQIDRSTNGAITANATFAYTASENTTGKPYTSIVAQRYDATAAKACGLPTGRWANPTGALQSAAAQSQSNVGYFSTTASGITAFSPWTLATIETPLPLQLLNFDAKLIDDRVKLVWITTNEQNVKEYEILKSVDNITYNSLGTVKAKGPLAGGLTDYFQWDNNLINGVQYYQLKTIDNTGQVSFSKIVKVIYKLSEFGFTSVSTSAIDGLIAIQFVSSSPLPCLLTVTDTFGRKILSKSLNNVSPGLNNTEIPFWGAAGAYTLELSNGVEQDTKLFIK